ncbi:hypothetical protein [Gorillibacterium sp. sgz5001074]|uniref:hypothetical protein n=1 Tax=Gorillibacterium sp. sgz5001074 TaxID=3446695 RepID=UPI003F673A29
MFVYEAIDTTWLKKLQEYQFKKPLEDGMPPADHWVVNPDKQEALYYIGWVSDAILRCNGEDMYEFAFFVKDHCIRVTAYLFPADSSEGWNKSNKLLIGETSWTGLSREEVEEDVKDAITTYLTCRNRGRRS